MNRILIIQPAFIGDVILATAVVEKLNQYFPSAHIDFLLRKGNESLLENNPHLNNVIVWDKKKNKFSNLIEISKQVRKNKYDYVINLHRFATSGYITILSGAKNKIGFDKNPLSFFYSKKFTHGIGHGFHEVDRNQQLITSITDDKAAKPKLYPSQNDFEKVKQITGTSEKYICIAPASVWFTKQFPVRKWVELIEQLKSSAIKIYLIGAPSDKIMCDEIISKSSYINIQNLAGQLSFLQSAALIKNAVMNYVNDSAPLHICSAMNAKTTAIYCSTVPAFGFGPLADDAIILEIKEKLSCRPCGLHGYKACPKRHFKCALEIDVSGLKFEV
ncbi:MAG: glycosyltransferase family 9 protein [Bacteroidia bacterium]